MEIVNYKTDSSRWAEAEYQKQLSVYTFCQSGSAERKVSTAIFYTAEDRLVEIEPIAREELRGLARKQSDQTT